jgi:uncharacterized protein
MFVYNIIFNPKGIIIILNTTTILEQFLTFHKEHTPNTLEEALEKFAIFGGVAWDKIDCSKNSFTLIEKLILPDFKYIRNDINEITTGMPLYHSILTGVAMGDGKTHTAYKRAKVSKELGDKAVGALCESGIIKLEKSQQFFISWKEKNSNDASDKLLFASPFLRFWFAFVSPLFKGVRDGDYKEVQERFTNREQEFLQLPFKELSKELVKKQFKEDPIVEMRSYWDQEIELDIYAKTDSGKIVVGTTKYANAKMKKNSLTKLREATNKAGIDADIFVLVNKNGFSSELKSLKGEDLKLFTLKHFKALL